MLVFVLVPQKLRLLSGCQSLPRWLLSPCSGPQPQTTPSPIHADSRPALVVGVVSVNPPFSLFFQTNKKSSETPVFSEFGVSKPDIYFQRMKSDLAYKMPGYHESFESTSLPVPMYIRVHLYRGTSNFSDTLYPQSPGWKINTK